MYKKEEHWTFVINWVRRNKRSIISHVTRLLSSHNLTIIDSDDCIQTAYEIAYVARCTCCKKGESDRFHGYFWNMLDKHFYSSGMIDYIKKDSFDELSEPDINNLCFYDDDRPKSLSEHKDTLIDEAIKKAIDIMTPTQKQVWIEILDKGCPTDKIAKQLGTQVGKDLTKGWNPKKDFLSLSVFM